jgi:hypothetical protein
LADPHKPESEAVGRSGALTGKGFEVELYESQEDLTGLSTSRLNNVVANGKPDEVSQRVEVELAHDRGPVCLHRLHAQV